MSVADRFRARFGLDDVGLYPLAILFGLNAVDELDRAAFNLLLPEIQDAFELDLSGLTTFLGLIVFLNLVLSTPLGFLADRSSRLRLARIGAGAWGTFSALTALVPGLGWLVGARTGADVGRSLNGPTHESLLSDYYPGSARSGAFTVHRMANSFGQLLGPGLAFIVFALLGSWRWPFLVLAVPTMVLIVASMKMRDPVRGRHERIAEGGDAYADIEDEAPSWEESWRIVKGIPTLVRIWRSLPFLLGGILAIGSLRNLFYDEVFGLGVGTRALLDISNEPFQLLGLFVGIPLVRRYIDTDPAKLFVAVAVSATATALGFIAFAISPNVWFAAASSFWIAFAASVIIPALTTLQSLLLPARVRSFGFVVGRLYAIPGLLAVIAVGRLGDRYGLRVGITVMAGVFLVGGYILASAGTKIAGDIDNVQKAALARAKAREAREAGEAKLLVCTGVDVHYGQVQVLFGVDFEVGDGEIVALLGTNGAGKSTLLKAVVGLVDPSGGAVVFDGDDATFASAQQLLARGMVYMPGGKAVFPTLTVDENLRVAAWLRRGDQLAVDAAIDGVLDRFPRLRERLDQPSGNLSGGEQQMLGLSMAFLAEPRLLMIDELSLGLAPTIVADLLDMVRDIHANGATIVLVEQSVNVALTLAERAVFMEKGEVRFEGPTADLLGRDDVLRSVFLEGAGKSLGASTGPAVQVREASRGVAPPLLVVEGVSKRFGGIDAVKQVSFDVRQGEVVGIIGPNGAGKTTLFDLISGFQTSSGGAIRLGSVDLTPLGPDARARAGLGRSFQDARLFPSMTVREALLMGFDRHMSGRDPVSNMLALPDNQVEERLANDRVDDLIDLLGLGAFADKFVSELSTGSRRIVDIGAAIAHDPDVLLLDEPSSGIAQRETEALGPLLQRICKLTGASLLVIEHDMPLITWISDRMVALDLGAVVTVGTPDEVISHPHVVASYLGGDDATIFRSGGASGMSNSPAPDPDRSDGAHPLRRRTPLVAEPPRD